MNRSAFTRFIAMTALVLLLVLRSTSACALTDVQIGNGPASPDGSYLNAQNIAATLAFTNVSVVATNSIAVVDPVDLSTGTFGPAFGSLGLQAPTVDINNSLNMSTASFIGLPNVATVNLSAKITTGSVMFNAAHYLNSGSITAVNVQTNSASIQQAVDLSSKISPVNVAIATGQYNEAVNVGRSITFSTGAANGHVNNGTLTTTSNTATLTLTGLSFTNSSTGTIAGVGTVDMSGLTLGGVTNSGVVAPGVSGAGMLAFDGAYVQQPSADLQIDIGGTSAGTQYDRLAISGSAALSGSLHVNLINSFTPSSSDVFTILTSLTVAGVFTNAPSTVPAGGGVFDVTYNPSSVVLDNFHFVPEPSSMMLMAPIVLLLGGRRKTAKTRGFPRKSVWSHGMRESS